ncbi:RNA-directed DNA polymerase, eukaryota [Tanacetum coccineum]|uniref:RNA-directed DNA polymerase, eukaryota n=1 Tax=Tanacetum coccineum TaxID=301880 RepID=A0ABQ5GWH8_9ASTR
MREVVADYGPSPFRVYHSWFTKDRFDKLVEDSWKTSSFADSSKITILRKKFQALKASIKAWCKDDKQRSSEYRLSIQSRLSDLDKMFDSGHSNEDLVNERTPLLKELHNINKCHSLDMAQKAKVRWSIEGDENSKPTGPNIVLDSNMFKQLSSEQIVDLECDVTYDEIKRAVWDCGTNKSPGPDGFTFDFIRTYWKIINQDVVNAVREFFVTSKFPPGSNSSFIALIPKKQDAKLVKDFRPISLIGCFYKIIAKILANRLSMVISDLISDVQSAFVPNRQILDGPFILNELISWCKFHKSKAMIFKVDFEKAFDSVRWDYLDGILSNFGFGSKWREWIHGCLTSAMGSILVNGSPTSEFKFHKGLKQGDPLSPFLFILVMESLHLSFNNILNAGLFKGIRIDDSLTLSHLFYADDAVFIGFSQEKIRAAAIIIGCSTFPIPSLSLCQDGMSSSKRKSWDEVIGKISARLSKWKIKTLSIGGRLTLIKSVLTSLPLYHMSIYKAPMGVLRDMESFRRRFFNGIDKNERKISMIDLSPKVRLFGLGLSLRCMASACLLSVLGSVLRSSPWNCIIRELSSLSSQGINLLAHLKKKVGNGVHTSFWEDSWINDIPLSQSYPRLTPRGGVEEDQFIQLVELVDSVILSNSNDRWVWLLDPFGEYSVSSTRTYIDDLLLPTVGSPTRWFTGESARIFSLVLMARLLGESVADQKLWIWHAYFGVLGANNDLNVLYGSSLFDAEIADISPECPFVVNGHTYRKCYYLADGIYPAWSMFVKTFSIARDEKTLKFKRVQEAARKDIERAFGVLQGRWGIRSP